MDKVERRRARAENLLVSQRNYRRARDRALTKLANRYKKQYLALLEQEKKNDEAQGNKWVDIGGLDGLDMGNLSKLFEPSGEIAPKNKGNNL